MFFWVVAAVIAVLVAVGWGVLCTLIVESYWKR
jgi:hypothetical protein